MSRRDEYIRTKLLFEVRPAQFLSLGFGNVVYSEADVVCISTFAESYFTPDSAIGALDRRLGEGTIDTLWPHDARRGGECSLIDVSGYGVDFQTLLIICMGSYESALRGNVITTYIRMGLHKAKSQLKSFAVPLQIDVTALGVQYGNVERRTSFDLLLQWAMDLFSACPHIDHIRLVAYDLDTFVDFFESLYQLQTLQAWRASELALTTPIDPEAYCDFRDDVAAVVRLWRTNPRQVVVLCRTIIETIVRRLCQTTLKRSPTTLYNDIRHLKDADVLPDYIFSYLETCRVLGNLSTHTDFSPSQRDVQGIVLLTLRVVEWFLGRT